MNLRRQSTTEPPLPLFALLEAPYGTGNAMLGFVAMYLLRRTGYTITEAAAITSVSFLPATFYFLYAPVTDFLFGRRTWYLGAVVLTAGLGAATVLGSTGHRPGLITSLLVAYVVGQALIGASTGGLMSTLLSPERKTKVGAWVQLGNQGTGTFGFGLLVYLSTGWSLPALALLTVGMMLPGLAVFLLPPSARQSAPEPFAETLRHFGQELGSIVRARRNLPGLLLLLSPLSIGALNAVLTGLSEEYHATAAQLAFANGWGGGVCIILGALSLLALPARWSSLTRYVVAGSLNGLVSLGVALSPLTPTTYVAGLLASNFTTGMSYASVTGLVLQLVGQAGQRQSSRYALVQSLSNFSLTYMIALEGYGADHHGTQAAAWIDAASSLLTAALAAILFMGASWRRKRCTDAGTLLAVNA